jgi:hypothetical protein
MEQIRIKELTKINNSWRFQVTLGTDPDTTSHTVTLDQKYWQKLTAGKITPPNLITKSFIFLLERESKESILPSFDLSLISTYFPDFEQTISR